MKAFSRLALGLLLTLLTAGIGSRTAIALTVPVAEDTYTSLTRTGPSVAESSGGAVSLPVSAKDTALLQFDLENLDAVPATITALNMNSAILQLYVVSALPAGDLTVHSVTTAWSEHFTGKPLAAPTINPAVLATIPAGEIGKKAFVTVDVTAAVRSALTSGSFDGFAIEAGGTTKVAIASKEGPASGYAANLFIDASNGPQANNDTAIGAGTLTSGTGGESANAAYGYYALANDTAGDADTALGANALESDTNGSFDTAVGSGALRNNKAAYNEAFGPGAMFNEVSGGHNTALGTNALFSNTNGAFNTAVGDSALGNTKGGANTAVGYFALANGTADTNDTAVGLDSLSALQSGVGNVAIGYRAGAKIVTGNFNLYVGNVDSGGASTDGTNENNTIRIGAGDQHTATYIAGIVGETPGDNNVAQVVIDQNGQLGTVVSSRRYKEDIHDMGDASGRLLQLRPVTFRYKKPFADGGKPIQYGLIAEEVAQVFPDLVARNAKGEPETVKYQLLAPLLLNEFLKARQVVTEQERKIAAQEKELADCEKRFADQEKTNETLTARLSAMEREMTLVARKVSDQGAPVANVGRKAEGKLAAQ